MWTWAKESEIRPGLFATFRASALCRRDTPINSAGDVIGWWESRRVPFNLLVASAGIFTCVVVAVVALGSEVLLNTEFGLPDPPLFALFGIIFYGILANVCFTGGWLAELFIRRFWPREADRFATLSFAFGLIFSILLTLAPAAVVGAGGIFRLLRHLHHSS